MNSSRTLIGWTLVAVTVVLSACSTAPVATKTDPSRVEIPRAPSRPPVLKNIAALKTQLGLNRRPSDLGFTEKTFDPCSYGESDSCAQQYLTVVNFQLLCRDSEGTVSSVPVNLTPIVHPNILWSLAGQSGGIATDSKGYGHLSVISNQPLRGHRLVLRKGANFVGLTVGEITKLILPKNWCS